MGDDSLNQAWHCEIGLYWRMVPLKVNHLFITLCESSDFLRAKTRNCWILKISGGRYTLLYSVSTYFIKSSIITKLSLIIETADKCGHSLQLLHKAWCSRLHFNLHLFSINLFSVNLTELLCMCEHLHSFEHFPHAHNTTWMFILHWYFIRC